MDFILYAAAGLVLAAVLVTVLALIVLRCSSRKIREEEAKEKRRRGQ